MRYGGGWHGPAYGGGYAGPYGYGRYPAYAGPAYVGYPSYYGGYYGYPYNNGWVAIGAGIVGAMLGAMMVAPPVYAYPVPAPPPPAVVQQCPDGSTVPIGSYCAAPQSPPPQPAPEPVQPAAPERGERG